MTRRVWLGAAVLAVVALWATALLARPGIVKVKTDSGATETYEGEVTEKPETVVVTIRGIPMTLDRRVVVSIQYVQGIEQQFRERLSKLAPRDAQGRIELARWAFDNRRYELAREAVEAAVKLDPNNVEADRLAETIRAQMRLEHARPPVGPGPGTEVRPTPAPGGPPERKFLSPADINAIRLGELKGTDNASVMFDRDVVRRFLSATNREPGQFNAMRKVDQALVILREGDAKMRDDIRVMGDPAALREYKQQVQPIVLSGCATLSCHGGTHAGNLALFNSTDEAATYTNFYILVTYTKVVQGGPVGLSGDTVRRKLVDRTQPELSLLAQYMLAPEVAEIDHPDVPGAAYKGIVPNKASPKYRTVINWMNNSLSPVEPNYGINYALPSNLPPPPTTKATTLPPPPPPLPPRPPATRPVGPLPPRAH